MHHTLCFILYFYTQAVSTLYTHEVQRPRVQALPLLKVENLQKC